MFRRLVILALLVVVGAFPSRTSAADAKPLALSGHEAGVHAVAFIGDGKLLATGSEDKTIRLWNAADGKVIATLKGHTGGVQSLAPAPDGKRLASADDGGVVKVWDITTGAELLTLKGQ